MTDRDTFAAAALTGYTANPAWDDVAASIVAEQAYADADAMLRERERVTEPMPKEKRAEVSSAIHDAAPAAKACTDPSESSVPRGNGGGCDRTDKAVTLPAVGTGDIPYSRTRDICERLRGWFKAVDAVPAIDLMDEAATEIERLRIRDYEREAIAAAAESVKFDDDSNWTTLKELLERTK